MQESNYCQSQGDGYLQGREGATMGMRHRRHVPLGGHVPLGLQKNYISLSGGSSKGTE